MAPTPASERVLRLRERHDPLARLVPPHLTLVFPFEDPISDEALEAEVGRAIGGGASFPVVLRRVTLHEGEYLFLNVERGNDLLIALHDALYTVLARHRSSLHTFVPHITVGRVARSEVAAALAASAACDGEIEGEVDRVSVYAIARDGTREIRCEVPLEAGGRSPSGGGGG